jgi:hypothetical protein
LRDVQLDKLSTLPTLLLLQTRASSGMHVACSWMTSPLLLTLLLTLLLLLLLLTLLLLFISLLLRYACGLKLDDKHPAVDTAAAAADAAAAVVSCYVFSGMHVG